MCYRPCTGAHGTAQSNRRFDGQQTPDFYSERGGVLRINACAAVQEAVSEHMPLCNYSPKCKATEQYLELSRKVISKVEG